jgi:hypothetical protein
MPLEKLTLFLFAIFAPFAVKTHGYWMKNDAA